MSSSVTRPNLNLPTDPFALISQVTSGEVSHEALEALVDHFVDETDALVEASHEADEEAEKARQKDEERRNELALEKQELAANSSRLQSEIGLCLQQIAAQEAARTTRIAEHQARLKSIKDAQAEEDQKAADLQAKVVALEAKKVELQAKLDAAKARTAQIFPDAIAMQVVRTHYGITW
jgi:chromosome segregation ATPase